jgi:hypothetical protein
LLHQHQELLVGALVGAFLVNKPTQHREHTHGLHLRVFTLCLLFVLAVVVLDLEAPLMAVVVVVAH